MIGRSPKTFTVEEAQQQLGAIVDLALGGESVAIVKDSKLLFLQESSSFEAIPMAPPGYFDDIYDEEYVRATNEAGR